MGKSAQKKISARKKKPTLPCVKCPNRKTAMEASKDTRGYSNAAVVSRAEEKRHIPTFNMKSRETKTKPPAAKEKLSGRNARYAAMAPMRSDPARNPAKKLKFFLFSRSKPKEPSYCFFPSVSIKQYSASRSNTTPSNA